MNLIFSQKQNEEQNKTKENFTSSTTSIKKVLRCRKCEKMEKELNEVIYLKYQSDQKYQEELLKNNLGQKQKEETLKQFQLLNASNTNLKNTLSLKDHEIEQLRNIITNLRNGNKQGFAFNQSQEAGQRVSRDVDVEHNEEINQYKSQLDVFGKRNCELESKLTQMVSEQSTIKQSFDKLKGENILLNEQLSQKKVENENLQLSLNRTREQNEFLSNRLNSLIQQFEEAKSIKEGVSKKNNELNQVVKQISTDKESKSMQLNEVYFQLERLKQENQLLKNNIRQYEYQNQLQNQQILMVKDNLVEHNKDNKLLLKENIELKEAIEKFQKNYEILSNEPKKDFQLEKNLKEDNILLKNENLAQLEEIKRITNENNFLKQYYNNTPQQIVSSEPIYVIKKLDQNEQADYSKMINELQLQKAKLEKMIEDLNEHDKNKDSLVSSLKNKVIRLEAENKELLNRTQIQDQQLINLNKNLVKEKHNNIILEEENINLTVDKDKLVTDIRNKNESIQKNFNSNANLMRLNTNKQEEILQLNNRLYQLQKMVETQNSALLAKDSEIEEGKRTIAKLKKEKDKLLDIIHKKIN